MYDRNKYWYSNDNYKNSDNYNNDNDDNDNRII